MTIFSEFKTGGGTIRQNLSATSIGVVPAEVRHAVSRWQRSAHFVRALLGRPPCRQSVRDSVGIYSFRASWYACFSEILGQKA